MVKHLTDDAQRGESGQFTLQKRKLSKEALNYFPLLERDGLEKMEPGSHQRCTGKGPEAMDTITKREFPCGHEENFFTTRAMQTVAPGRWCLHLQRFLKIEWNKP